MSTILVTGSAGFIGFHVTKALLEAGETVIGLDNFTPYYAPELKWAREEVLRSNSHYFSVQTDLVNREAVKRCFHDFSPDIVCHLAAQAGVRYSLQSARVSAV